jgi:hypothetical protein
MINKQVADSIDIFFKISLEIGNSLNFGEMLKKGLISFLRNLDCEAGVVYRLCKIKNGKYPLIPIFSLPYALFETKRYGVCDLQRSIID